MAWSKVWGTILVTAAVLVLLFLTVALLLLTDLDLWSFLLSGEYGGMWSSIPYILLGVGILILAAGETVIWRTVKGYVVR